MSRDASHIALQQAIGYDFRDSCLLERALTHRSFANEAVGTRAGATVGTVGLDNERLEFLGDAVMELILTHSLMSRFPEDSEGSLSKKRASLVNEDVLAHLALDLKMDAVIRVGKGEARTGGGQRPRLLASALEALIGATFLDGGYESAQRMVERLFVVKLDEVGRSEIAYHGDFKTRLQERVQELHRVTPLYRIEKESGPDHDKFFEVSVHIGGDGAVASGSGKSKKTAEQDAARKALEILK